MLTFLKKKYVLLFRETRKGFLDFSIADTLQNLELDWIRHVALARGGKRGMTAVATVWDEI